MKGWLGTFLEAVITPIMFAAMVANIMDGQMLFATLFAFLFMHDLLDDLREMKHRINVTFTQD